MGSNKSHSDMAESKQTSETDVQTTYVAQIPVDSLTEQSAIEIVTKNGKLLKRIPDHLKTIDVCYAAVKSCGSSIEFVPRRLLNQELVDIATAQNSKNAKFVVNEFYTLDQVYKQYTKREKTLPELIAKYPSYAQRIADKAFKENEFTIEQIPIEYRTEAMYNYIVSHKWQLAGCYKYLPKKYLTKEGYLIGNFEFSDVPTEFIDNQIRIRFFRKDPVKYYNILPDEINTTAFKIKFLVSLRDTRRRPIGKCLPDSFYADPLVLQVSIICWFPIPEKYKTHPLYELQAVCAGNKKPYTTLDAIRIAELLQ